jgi:hypothetical protein
MTFNEFEIGYKLIDAILKTKSTEILDVLKNCFYSYFLI